MNIFPVVTFFHVVGAIAIFVSWALEYNYLTAMRQSLRTNSKEVALKESKAYAKLGTVGMLITLGTGIWLMVALWGSVSWIMMSLFSIVLLIITGIIFSRKANSVKADKLRDLSYQISSARLRIAIGMGIVALMVIKTTDLLSSLFIVFIFLIAGGFWIMPVLKKTTFSNEEEMFANR